jgi:hypothetical protein
MNDEDKNNGVIVQVEGWTDGVQVFINGKPIEDDLTRKQIENRSPFVRLEQ